MTRKLLKIDELEFRKNLYSRARGDTLWLTTYRYAEEMKAGAKFNIDMLIMMWAFLVL
jgi:hypothetical protein